MKQLCVAALLVTLLAACGGQNSQPAPGHAPKAHESKVQLPVITIDSARLHVEIVQDPASRQKGLMHRQSLPEDQGMLFVFEHPQYMSFWMRNTFIPLDIAFIDADGRIVDIQSMAPLDETKQYISAAPALYALEVNQGWFKKHGIKAGSVVKF